MNLFCHMESRHKLLLILWTGDMQGKGGWTNCFPPVYITRCTAHPAEGPKCRSEVVVRTVPMPVRQWQARWSGREGFQLTNRERYTVLLHIISMLFVTSFLTPVRFIVTDEEPNCYCLLCY